MRRVPLERERELARIAASVASALRGAGSAVVLEGPAGIGKTCLLEVGRELAGTRGLEVYGAGGTEFESSFAFGGVRQLFEMAVTALPASERTALFRGAARDAAPVLGFGRKSAPGAVDGVGPFHGLYRLTDHLARRKPVLLCVDDAHWVDCASLRFLLYLAPRLDRVPAVVLIATRDGERGPGTALLDALMGGANVHVMRPGALTAGAVCRLLSDEFPDRSVDDRFAEACSTATGGNPFLLRELVAALTAERFAPEAASIHRVRDLAPRAVSQWILQRLARLPSAALDIARAVAVLGDGAALSRVLALAGVDDHEAEGSVDALVASGILRTEPALAFVHPVVRCAVYTDIPLTRRVAAHGRAASLVAAAGGSLDEVANHLLAAKPSGSIETVATLRRAACDAVRRGAPEAAVRYLDRALAEPQPRGRRSALLAELGEVELAAGNPAKAVDHLEQAIGAIATGPALVSTAFQLLMARCWSGRVLDGLEVFDDLVGRTDLEPADATLLESGVVSALILDYSAANRFQPRIRRLRDASGKPGAPAHMAAIGAEARLFANEPIADVLALAEQAVARWHEIPRSAQALFFFHLAATLVFGGHYTLADGLLASMRDRSRRLGLVPEFTGSKAFLATVAYRRGQLEDAIAEAGTALELARLHGQELMVPVPAAVLVNALVDRGQLTEAASVLESVPDPAGRSTAPFTLLLHARGRLRGAQHRYSEALADLAGCGARQGAAAVTAAPICWRSDAALVHAILGNDGEARRLAGEELDLTRSQGEPRALGIALRTAARVSLDDRERVYLLEEAASVLDQSQAAVEHAGALTDLGSALRRTSGPLVARPPLRAAWAIATRGGAAVLAERARVELVATGARPGGRPSALTPSELRVAGLAAGGATNRQIAATLVVSARTVENHLARVFRKLDIHSRHELPAGLAAQSGDASGT